LDEGLRQIQALDQDTASPASSCLTPARLAGLTETNRESPVCALASTDQAGDHGSHAQSSELQEPPRRRD
jgi:hypothetical protein